MTAARDWTPLFPADGWAFVKVTLELKTHIALKNRDKTYGIIRNPTPYTWQFDCASTTATSYVCTIATKGNRFHYSGEKGPTEEKGANDRLPEHPGAAWCGPLRMPNASNRIRATSRWYDWLSRWTFLISVRKRTSAESMTTHSYYGVLFFSFHVLSERIHC